MKDNNEKLVQLLTNLADTAIEAQRVADKTTLLVQAISTLMLQPGNTKSDTACAAKDDTNLHSAVFQKFLDNQSTDFGNNKCQQFLKAVEEDIRNHNPVGAAHAMASYIQCMRRPIVPIE